MLGLIRKETVPWDGVISICLPYHYAPVVELGRHNRLRICRLRAWEFESPRGHENKRRIC